METSIRVAVEVLREEVRNWEEAAARCESAISMMPDEEKRSEWAMTAASYRERAKNLRAVIELVTRESS